MTIRIKNPSLYARRDKVTVLTGLAAGEQGIVVDAQDGYDDYGVKLIERPGKPVVYYGPDQIEHAGGAR